MKKLFSHLMSIGIVFLMASAVSGAETNGGCQIQGNWISYDENGVPAWVAGIQGQSASTGTADVEYPAVFTTLPTPDGPLFPEAVGGTHMRGAWDRTGGNSFAYTLVGFGFGENGVTLWLGRLSGEITLTDDCNSGVFTGTLYIFPCAVDCSDPYGPTDGLPIPSSIGYRVRVK